jgi:hypothetical protein
VFYVSDSLGQPGGSIYTVNMSGNILRTLPISNVIGDNLEAMAYDQSRSGHLFLLTYGFANCDPNGCDFAYSFFDISPDGSTVYLNARLQGPQCGDRMTVTSQNLWVSCGSEETIRQYTRTGALGKEASVAALLTPPNVPFSRAPDFGRGLLVNDFNGERILDISTQGDRLAAVSTQSLSSRNCYWDGDRCDQRPDLPEYRRADGLYFYLRSSCRRPRRSSSRIRVGRLGESPEQFALTDNCPATLGIAHTCNLQFTFRPTKPGSFKAVIQLNDDAPDARKPFR